MRSQNARFRKGRKGNKRERTRARLVEAAVQLIREKGYDRTTLEEVAAKAGMTRGAIYGNYKNREDLFVAVVETRWKPIAPPLKHGAPLKEQLRIIGKALVTALPDRRAAAIGAASFQVYALTHPEMRSRLARENKAIYKWAARELLCFVPQEKLPMPVNKFVRVLHALSDGLASLHSMSPELITEDVIVSAFEALA